MTSLAVIICYLGPCMAPAQQTDQVATPHHADSPPAEHPPGRVAQGAKPAVFGNEWTSLFPTSRDLRFGRAQSADELENWTLTQFGGEGAVAIDKGIVSVLPGTPLTGLTYTGKGLPTTNYEIRLHARRVEGRDFFSALTFPIGESHATLVVGGWGGGVVGISCIDGYDASENQSTTYRKFDHNRWYAIRVRVTDRLLAAWIDDDRCVDVDPSEHKFEVRTEVVRSRPLGLAAFETAAEWRDLELRLLPAVANPPPVPGNP